MFRRREKSKIALGNNSNKDSFLTPAFIVKIALIGFVLGTILCSFGPPSHEEGLKERETMLSNISDNTTTPKASQEDATVQGARYETATFSMG